MNLHIDLNHMTTQHQLRALAAFCTTLAADLNTSPAPSYTQVVGGTEAFNVQSSVAEQASVDTAVVGPEIEQPKVTRRRRTKAEIEADEAAAKIAAENSTVADAEAAAQKNNEAGPAETVVKTTDGGEKVDTKTGEITSGVDSFETVTPDGAGDYTEGEVQALATLIARSKGPDVVRNKITELGGTRISALTALQINQLGAFLESQK